MNDPSIAVAMLGSGSRRRTAGARASWLPSMFRRLHALLNGLPGHG
jgi:hypothetical protein